MPKPQKSYLDIGFDRTLRRVDEKEELRRQKDWEKHESEMEKLELEQEVMKNQLTKKPMNPRQEIVAAIPKGGKYRKPRNMAKLFSKKMQVANYLLAQCIASTVLDNRSKGRKLRRDEYDSNKFTKKSYDIRIKNLFRTLKKYWKPLGYTVQFHSQFSEVVLIQE